MVTYGPWQDSRIHEELFTLKDADDTDRTIELLGEEPTVRSGWDASNLAALSWAAIGGAAENYAREIDDPPAPNPDLSGEAFEAAMSDTVVSGGAMQFAMLQTGEQYFATPPPEWTQEQQWDFSGACYRLWFDPELEGDTRGVRYAVPPGMDDTDDYYLELEPPREGADRVEIIEATVLSSPGADYKLFVKDVHLHDAVPFLRSAVAQGGAATSIQDARNFPDADDDLPLDHITLTTLAWDGVPVIGDDWSLDGRMPTMSVLYAGPDLTVATLNGDHGVDQTYDGLPVRIRIRYRWPRWRKVFYDGPPYRRITRRGDGLAGGARRTGGRVKTIQGSNRRGAGAIV
jgi:hypothetical protein